jgi:hypothetical protein
MCGLLTGAEACLSAAIHRPLAKSSMLAAASGPFSAGQGSIDDIL